MNEKIIVRDGDVIQIFTVVNMPSADWLTTVAVRRFQYETSVAQEIRALEEMKAKKIELEESITRQTEFVQNLARMD